MNLLKSLLVFSLVYYFVACTTQYVKPYNSSMVQNPEVFFPTAPKDGVLKILVFGDSGTGDKHQFQVAESMQKVCKKEECQFGLMLGDNFYEVGVSDADDSQFIEKFEKPYSPLNINFYPVSGNHDHGYVGLKGNAYAQVEYTKKSKYWKMPHLYYSYTVGDTEFFALDTNMLRNGDTEQLNWFLNALKSSKNKVKIVYGHHAIFSYGKHGTDQYLKDNIYKQICESADAYLAGHDHDLQLLKSDCGLPLLVSGAAAKLRNTSKGDMTMFHASQRGFNRVIIKGSNIQIIFYDENGKELYQASFEKKK